jgi:RNA polymerase sigma factor (TIGR02999 family)
VAFETLTQQRSGDDDRAQQELLSRYYREFRMIARRVLNGSGSRITIQPTDLVHEASMRLLAGQGVKVADEAHFLALGARVMRMTLIDEVRRRKADKRGSNVITQWDYRADAASEDDALDIEEFDGVLERLAGIDPESARIVELRFYVGLTMDEIATSLGISESTVHRRWRSARAWLLKEMQDAA